MSRCKIPEKERAAKIMTALNLKKNEGLSGNDPPPFTIIIIIKQKNLPVKKKNTLSLAPAVV